MVNEEDSPNGTGNRSTMKMDQVVKILIEDSKKEMDNEGKKIIP